MEFFLLTGSFC
uniref:Uncharacterized protein n=1 Tax=Rhizophora mucronata TaxID=61149 RepID=A0A2P2PGQ9_RHIMU